MTRNLFYINENEKERILNMHKNAISKQYLHEQENYYKDTVTGLVTKVNGPYAAPKNTTQSSKTEYDAQENKKLQLSNNPAPALKELPKYSGSAPVKQGPAGDPYQYKRDTGKTFYAKKGTEDWKEQTITRGVEAINALLGDDVASDKLALNSKPLVTNPTAPTQLAGTTPTDTNDPKVINPTIKLAGTPPIDTVNMTKEVIRSLNNPNAPTQLAGTTTPTNNQTPSAVTSNNPEVFADLKTAKEIKQEFRQGVKNKNKMQRQYNKMYRTYNKLSDKMDRKTDLAYLDALNTLNDQLKQL